MRPWSNSSPLRNTVGTAITCETGPNDNLAILAAIALAKPGDVVVAASEGFTQSAVIGDNVAWCAKNMGLAALVLDGMARDLEGDFDVIMPDARGHGLSEAPDGGYSSTERAADHLLAQQLCAERANSEDVGDRVRVPALGQHRHGHYAPDCAT